MGQTFAPAQKRTTRTIPFFITQKHQFHLDQHSFSPLKIWLLMTTPKSLTLLVCLHVLPLNSANVSSVNVSLGGNSLDRAPAGRVHDFVKANGGHTVITKVSIMK
jgi:hypothetical protein